MATILAVDDDRDILLVVEDSLALEGHDVVTTTRPEQLPTLLGEHDVDLILLDIDMPGVSGFEVLRALRDDEVSRAIPVIFLSALGDALYRVEGLRGGAVDYVTKPFDPEELSLRVKLALERSGPPARSCESLTGDALAEALRQREFPAGSKLLDRYEPRSVLGSGGHGAVLSAWDPALERKVAIKLLDLPSSGLRHAALERCRKEGRLLAQLDHPGLVRIYDIASDEQYVFVVLEFLEGETLHQKLQIDGPYAQREFLPLARRLCEALAHAHERGLVHRDLSTTNIMLTTAGPTITDFGLAALHDELLQEEHQIVGTPCYIAPETLVGQPASPASDIFSLGCIFYEMLAGRRAFDRSSSPNGNPMTSTLSEDVTPLHLVVASIGPELARLVQKMLDPVSRERPSAAAIGEALTQLTPETTPRKDAAP